MQRPGIGSVGYGTGIHRVIRVIARHEWLCSATLCFGPAKIRSKCLISSDRGLYPHPDPEKRGKLDRLLEDEIAKAIRDTPNTYDPNYNSEPPELQALPSDGQEIATDGARPIVSKWAMDAVLVVLRENDELPGKEIVKQVDWGRTQVYKALEYLEARELIDRCEDPFDSRRTIYYPT